MSVSVACVSAQGVCGLRALSFLCHCNCLLDHALYHCFWSRMSDSLSQSSRQPPSETSRSAFDGAMLPVVSARATCKPRRPRWWYWARGDALSGLLQLKAPVYEDVEVKCGARVLWSLSYILDAIPFAKMKPCVWLVSGGASQNWLRFVTDNGVHHRDFRPSQLSVRRWKKVHDSHRSQWLDADYTCGTLCLISLLLYWARSLKGPSSVVAQIVFRDVLVKVCSGITVSEAHELSPGASDVAALVVVGMTPAEVSVSHVISACSCARERGCRATTTQLQILATSIAKLTC